MIAGSSVRRAIRETFRRGCVAILAAFVFFATPVVVAAQSKDPTPVSSQGDADQGSFGTLLDLVRSARGVVDQVFETFTVAHQLVVGVSHGPIAFTSQGFKLLARTYGEIWSLWGTIERGPISVGDLLAELGTLTDQVEYILTNELVPGEPAVDGPDEATSTPSPSVTEEPAPDGTPVPTPTLSPTADATTEPEPIASP